MRRLLLFATLCVLFVGFTQALVPELDPFEHVGNPQTRIDPGSEPVYSETNERVISNALCAERELLDDERGLNALHTFFLQIAVDHDIVLTPEIPMAFDPIPVPQGDPHLDPEATGNAIIHFRPVGRNPVNMLTPFVDGSFIYGVDETRLAALRDSDPQSGALRGMDGGRLLPPLNSENLPVAKGAGVATEMFLVGDVRGSENSFGTAVHEVARRSHNYELAREDNGLFGENAFERARQLNIAIWQRITFEEAIPALLGEANFVCEPDTEPDGDAVEMLNVFAAAAFRFGHSQINNATILALQEEGIAVEEFADIFFKPEVIREADSIEPFLWAAYTTPARRVDNQIVDSLRNILFTQGHGRDLASINIKRGRDTGVPPYNEVRDAFDLAPVESFEDLLGAAHPLLEAFESVYPDGPDTCDTWVCGLAEPHVEGSSLGELFTEILRIQFCALRDLDPNYYTRATYLSEEDRAYVSQRSLSDVLCDTVGGRLCGTEGNWAFIIKEEEGTNSNRTAIVAGTIVSVLFMFMLCAVTLWGV